MKDSWWTIPGEFSKNGLSHRVPLTKSALRIINTLPPRKNGQVWVFPSPTREGQFIANVQKAAQRLRQSAQIDNFVLHDSRRTAASYMASLGIPGAILGKIMNHVETGVTRVYDRYSYDNEKRHGLEVWEKHLLAILETSTFLDTPEMLWDFWLENGAKIMEEAEKEAKNEEVEDTRTITNSEEPRPTESNGDLSAEQYAALDGIRDMQR